FGSYKYTAEKLIQKGVLLSVEDYSLKQLDKLSITVSSDEDGVFRIEASLFGAKIPGGEEELRIEDLLQAQFDGLQMIRLFDGAVKVNLNLLIFLINKKWKAECGADFKEPRTAGRFVGDGLVWFAPLARPEARSTTEFCEGIFSLCA
ncbi:MAG: hypothetical protein BJ554DRAFT_464, partial [Olpidium bornovanus]